MFRLSSQARKQHEPQCSHNIFCSHERGEFCNMECDTKHKRWEQRLTRRMCSIKLMMTQGRLKKKIWKCYEHVWQLCVCVHIGGFLLRIATLCKLDFFNAIYLNQNQHYFYFFSSCTLLSITFQVAKLETVSLILAMITYCCVSSRISGPKYRLKQ